MNRYRMILVVPLVMALAGIVCIVGLVILLWFGQQNAPRPPVYSASEIASICAIFGVEDDLFCDGSEARGARTFDAMLRRRFPPRFTRYEDVMPLVERYVTGSGGCVDDYSRYADVCPVPTACTTDLRWGAFYTCSIGIPSEDRGFLIAFFKQSGGVSHYYGFALDVGS